MVDDEDFEWLNRWKWCAHLANKKTAVYARTAFVDEFGVLRKVLMHRMILGVTDLGITVDHKNLCGIDNQRGNLRTCTRRESSINRGLFKSNSSGKRGVNWNKKRGKWCASISINRLTVGLGCYDDIDFAARAYDKKAREVFGEIARLNFPDQP